MRLIMLAAGRGVRLGRLTDHLPKPLLPLPDGTTVLERNIQAIEAVAKIDETLIVSGHASDAIDAACARMRIHKPISIQYNPFYHTSGPIVSVWLTHVQMREADFLLCNGDTVFGRTAFESLAAGEAAKIMLGVDRRTRRGSDDMKTVLDSGGYLMRVGKDILDERANAISAGLLAVSGAAMRQAFVAAVCQMVRDPQCLLPGVAWHSVLNALVECGTCVTSLDLQTEDWHEIDTVEDLNSVRVPPA